MWLELLMFPKAVLRQNKRGQRRGQMLIFIKIPSDTLAVGGAPRISG